ncbi:hypothetical protein LTR70_008591 [Exophiala xenobiotica]|uniref:Uncharacterized protein n=1 Tax=Lithohypha guttulata TaxID=1690604 RepID=A0ABR0K095_9EURO|nr:hypothetical protein LTR24_008300 [Lithohypha guttulata]KAK5311732.1 hypothetical protein LTR70_008591 [Exophiala xenobiotica]
MSTKAARPSLRKTTRRQKKSYREPDSESETDVATPPARRSLPYRASRYLRDAYQDDTPTESSSSSEDDTPPPIQLRPFIPTKRKTRSIGPVRNTAFKSFKRRKTTHNHDSANAVCDLKDKSLPGVTTPIASRSGQVPPWQNLEYQVLLKVMQYAAYPLYTDASRDTGSVRWLSNTSEMCSSFHDACIGALMYSPPLFPAHRAHWLMDLLKASARDYDKDSASPASAAEGQADIAAPPVVPNHNRRISLDYRKKIRSLNVEVKQILIKKAGIDLAELVQYTPLLKDLRLYHNHDSLADKYIWATPSGSRSKDRWSYDSLFDTLERSHIELHSFEWNGRFLKDDTALSLFSNFQTHSQCLRKLRSISLRNFMLPRAEKLVDHVTGTHISDAEKLDNADAQQLASWRSIIINALTSLTELRELYIHACNVFDDATIASLPAALTHLTICNTPFVRSEGLHDYFSASGAKLTDLILRGNQSLGLGFMSTLGATTPYLRKLEVDLTYHDPTSFRDTEPLFDELLPNGPPTWPGSLETVSIGPLRNLSTDDAEGFFQSLVDAAPTLLHLRTLSLRTLLKKASWRDRAQMRVKWGGKLHETFSVKCNSEVFAPSQPRVDPNDEGRKSRRINGTTQLTDTQVQGRGRCHTVIFDLSDQRPAQEQFREADFLDSEPEGDEEWNGKDDAVEAPKYSSRRYAW